MTPAQRDNIARAAIILDGRRYGKMDCPICKKADSLHFYKKTDPGGTTHIVASCLARDCVESTHL